MVRRRGEALNVCPECHGRTISSDVNDEVGSWTDTCTACGHAVTEYPVDHPGKIVGGFPWRSKPKK